MKKNKLAEIAIILGIILIILISFVGIYVQNQTNMENIINEFSMGEELDGYIELVFDTKDSISEENVKISKEIMEKRLDDIGLEEYKMYENTENGNILLQLSTEANAKYIGNCLIQKGVFEIVDTETKEVLLDRSSVKTANTLYNTQANGYSIFMAIEFNEEGTKKLEEISRKYIAVTTDEKETEENAEAKTISINLDGNTIISTAFSEAITDGVLYITVGSISTDSTALLTYVEESTKVSTAIKNGIMPLSYSLNSNTYISSSIMESDIINFAYVVGLITIVSLIVIIVKYRKMGLLSSLAYLGYIALFLLIIRYTDCAITLNSICGIVLIMILNFVFTVKIAKDIKSDDSIADVKEKLKQKMIEFIMILVPMAILLVVTAFTGISNLGIILFWGIITMIAYNFIVTKNLLEVRTRI